MRSYTQSMCPVARKSMIMGKDALLRLSKKVGNVSAGGIISTSKIENKNLFHAFLGKRCYIIEPSYFVETPELLESIETPLFEVGE